MLRATPQMPQQQQQPTIIDRCMLCLHWPSGVGVNGQGLACRRAYMLMDMLARWAIKMGVHEKFSTEATEAGAP